MNITFQFAPGFLDCIVKLYQVLGCCILQSLITEQLKDHATPKAALVAQLNSVSAASNDQGSCQMFLKKHGDRPLWDMINHMDVTVCCHFLLDAELGFGKDEVDAIHAVRKGRNLGSHDVDTAAYTDDENEELWRSNRDALLNRAEGSPRVPGPTFSPRSRPIMRERRVPIGPRRRASSSGSNTSWPTAESPRP